MSQHLLTGQIFFLYADPGSGALIWQLLVAAFIGSMFYVRRIKDWIVLKRKTGATPSSLPTNLQDEDKSKS